MSFFCRRTGWLLLQAIVITIGITVTATADVRLDSELTVGADSNVTNAGETNDKAQSEFVRVGGSATSTHRVGQHWLLRARGSLEGEYFRDFDGLSNAKMTGMGRAMWRPGSNFHSPTYAIWASAAMWEFDSKIRDSFVYQAGTFVTRQFTTRVSGRLASTYTWRDSDSRVFDTEAASVLVNFDFLLTPKFTLYTSYQFTSGDTVSTAEPTFKIINAAEVIEADEVFGGAASNRQAYRLDHLGHVLTIGGNEALSAKLSLDMQLRYAVIRGDGDNNYERLQAVLSLLKRF